MKEQCPGTLGSPIPITKAGLAPEEEEYSVQQVPDTT